MSNQENVINEKNLSELVSILNQALIKERMKYSSKTVENFGCDNVCTKTENKQIFEREETKILLLLLVLIVFYGFIGK